MNVKIILYVSLLLLIWINIGASSNIAPQTIITPAIDNKRGITQNHASELTSIYVDVAIPNKMNGIKINLTNIENTSEFFLEYPAFILAK